MVSDERKCHTDSDIRADSDPMNKIGVLALFFAGFYTHQLVLGI